MERISISMDVLAMANIVMSYRSINPSGAFFMIRRFSRSTSNHDPRARTVRGLRGRPPGSTARSAPTRAASRARPPRRARWPAASTTSPADDFVRVEESLRGRGRRPRPGIESSPSCSARAASEVGDALEGDQHPLAARSRAPRCAAHGIRRRAARCTTAPAAKRSGKSVKRPDRASPASPCGRRDDADEDLVTLNQ